MYHLKGERNPLITFDDGTTVQNLGDVHLGRTYVNGVPLDQRGKIEAKQMAEFERLLDVDADYLVQNGDIFDKFTVDNAVVEYAATKVLEAKRKRPDRKDVYIRGNHDDSKDVTKVSSFDIFQKILEESGEPNLYVVTTLMGIDDFMFFGWSPDQAAEDLAKTVKGIKVKAAFGHWDVNLPDHSSKFNLVPVDQLKEVTDLVVTGHDHKPGTLERDGVTIVKVGSVIPLAHGEETEADAFIYTIELKDYDPAIHDGKIVRFILDDEEEVPEGDFLQVKVLPKIAAKTTTTETDNEPETDSFELTDVLQDFLEKQELGDTTVADVVERFKSANVE